MTPKLLNGAFLRKSPVLFSLSCRDEALVSFSGLTFTRSGRNGADTHTPHTHTHTHAHTHEPSTVTLAAHARVTVLNSRGYSQADEGW